MGNEIQVLKQTELLGQRLTVYGTKEQPLFLAKDVAEWIEHRDTSTMMRCVESDERILMTNPNNVCGGQSAWFLTEDGLYLALVRVY